MSIRRGSTSGPPGRTDSGRSALHRWSLSSAYGKQVYFFGIPLPALVAPDGDLGDTLGTWHLNAAWALLALVLLHIGAALWHHLVLRDGLLRRVLPGKQA
ncbi:hypothetical protein FICKIIDM_04094 [Xanthomonas citri pv. punicae]|nr:hypothetical protein FICKIIDM_04094 [Xanthomonas citri pv. punicae]